jgi:lambda family phage portal protein
MAKEPTKAAAASPSMPHVRRSRIQASRGDPAYSGASNIDQNIALWQPTLRSADSEILRDASKVRARARDLERNHPYARQAIRASRLGVIGKKLRYSCRPDHRFLGIDFEEAVRWGQEFERVWETYAHGPGFYLDAGRRLSFTQHMGLAHDRDFVDGESLTTAEWDPNRKWRTCFQAIDVDRLSNPHGRPETPYLKGGVALDTLSAPVGYWIRDGHPGDIGVLGARTMTWSFVRRETDWGRPVVLHTFDTQRAGQTRGISEFASVIRDMKMGREYTETALAAAILQASYAAVLVSQQNYKDALEIIAASPPDDQPSLADVALENLEAAVAYHEEAKIRFNGAQVPILWPGEDLKLLTPGQGATSLGEFQSHAIKSYAAGLGTDPISVSQDYSNVNYSSAKMAAATNWRSYEARRERLMGGVAMPMVASFLEETVFSGAMPLPKGVSELDFYEAQAALIKGTFITAGAPMLDPVKERQAQKLGVEIGVETLQDIAAEEGKDYLELLDQLQREAMERTARGLPPPSPLMMMPNALPGTGERKGTT